jgi:hypothetical protein
VAAAAEREPRAAAHAAAFVAWTEMAHGWPWSPNAMVFFFSPSARLGFECNEAGGVPFGARSRPVSRRLTVVRRGVDGYRCREIVSEWRK